MDYDIYSDPSHRQTVHQLTKKIIAQLEEPNLSIADDLIDPLIDMTVDDQYSSMETYDYAMGAGGLDSFIYLIVPVVVQMISILEYNRSLNYKEVVPMLIDHAIQRSNFPKKLSWLGTPVLTYKLKKLSKHIQDAVEQLLNKTNETST